MNSHKHWCWCTKLEGWFEKKLRLDVDLWEMNGSRAVKLVLDEPNTSTVQVSHLERTAIDFCWLAPVPERSRTCSQQTPHVRIRV